MPTPETTTIIENNKSIARRLIHEFWNNGRPELAVELVSHEYERIELFTPGMLHGPDGLMQAAMIWRGAFPDARITIDDIIAENDEVAMQWTFTGTHLGELNGTPATGREVKVQGMSICTIVDGKIRKEIVSADMLTLLKQLGILAS